MVENNLEYSERERKVISRYLLHDSKNNQFSMLGGLYKIDRRYGLNLREIENILEHSKSEARLVALPVDMRIFAGRVSNMPNINLPYQFAIVSKEAAEFYLREKGISNEENNERLSQAGFLTPALDVPGFAVSAPFLN